MASQTCKRLNVLGLDRESMYPHRKPHSLSLPPVAQNSLESKEEQSDQAETQSCLRCQSLCSLLRRRASVMQMQGLGRCLQFVCYSASSRSVLSGKKRKRGMPHNALLNCCGRDCDVSARDLLTIDCAGILGPSYYCDSKDVYVISATAQWRNEHLNVSSKQIFVASYLAASSRS